MNYFDIRKLQSTLATIKVAFLRANLSLNNADIQSLLQSIPSVAVHGESLDSAEKIRAELTPSTPVDAQMNIIKTTEAISNILRSSTGCNICSHVKTGGDINNAIIDLVLGNMLKVTYKSEFDIDKISGDLLDSLNAETSLDESSLYVDLDDIVAYVYNATHAEGKNQDIKLHLDDIATNILDWCGIQPCKTVTAIDFSQAGEIYDAAHVDSTEIKEKINIKNTIIELASDGGIQTSALNIKVLGIKELVVRLTPTIQAASKVYEEIKLKTIVQLLSTANISGEMNLGFSIEDKLSFAVAVSLLYQIGVRAGFTVSPDGADSSRINIRPLNLENIFEDIKLSYGLSQRFASAIDVALNIVAQAEMETKDVATFNPEKYIASGTLCVVLNDIETIAAIALFKSVFGARAQASLGESKGSSVDEEVNIDLSSKVMVCTANHIESLFSSGCKISASLGFNITKFISDYIGTTLGAVKSKTLEQLCVEYIN